MVMTAFTSVINDRCGLEPLASQVQCSSGYTTIDKERSFGGCRTQPLPKCWK